MLVIVASLIPVPYEAVAPGSALNVGRLVGVPRSDRHPHPGKVLMVDVQLIPLNALDYLYFRWQPSDQVLSTNSVQGSESTATYDAQGRIDMALARENAIFVALRHLGYPVRLDPTSIVVYASLGPASGVLHAGDVLTSVAGHSVPTLVSLKGVLATLRPGQRVKVIFKAIGGGRSHVRELRLGALVRGSNAAVRCMKTPALSASAKELPCIGIDVQQLGSVVGAPFRVNVNAEGIIGPSAGLAFTLGLMEVLGKEDLTHGRIIGATGTISPSGAVGDVGGVAQKTLAVRRAGASVFLVPSAEYQVAKHNAGGHLQVLAVSSVAQALVALERLRNR